MNSILQCISHTELLRNYIFADGYKNDINRKIPKNQLKSIYYLREIIIILKQLWEKNHIVEPISLRNCIVNYNNQFRGNMQNDAHEFLVFLIDELHISLSSRVKIEYSGIAQNKDDEYAIEAVKNWSNNFEKAYSPITDMFFGQYHSIVTCSNDDCNYASSNFDPFCYLSVPLPSGDGDHN